jgi:cysteinyl-tRNA synthetase
MQLYLYDSLTKETKQAVINQTTALYCCGLTPYDTIHLGHLRTFFMFSVLERLLAYKSDTWVVSARNITDVDDKILAKALQSGKPFLEIVDFYIAEQKRLLGVFHIQNPTYEPRVTEHMGGIIDMIARLLEKKYAYCVESGIYFRVHAFEKYGSLSGNSLEQLQHGVRKDTQGDKENPLDFALWKFAVGSHEQDDVLLAAWDSPWGKGRPGWHIECSAMNQALFGPSIDIHMGGRDLIFPHHECELAQTEACSGKSFSRIWMHTGMVTLYGSKMSKSTQHFVSIESYLERFTPDALKLNFLSTHYSKPFDFTWESCEENTKKIYKLYQFHALIHKCFGGAKPTDVSVLEQENYTETWKNLYNLHNALQDSVSKELNTPECFGILFKWIKEANKAIAVWQKTKAGLTTTEQYNIVQCWDMVWQFLQTNFGLFALSYAEFSAQHAALTKTETVSVEYIEEQLQLRQQYRANKQWELADTVRRSLESHSIHINDTPTGAEWFLSF